MAIGPSGIISVEATEFSTGKEAILGVDGGSGSLVYQIALPVSTYTDSGCGSPSANIPAGFGAPVVGPDGALYLEVETFQESETTEEVPVDSGVDFTCEVVSESFSDKLQLLHITPAGSAQYQTIATSSSLPAYSVDFYPGEVIADGSGGMLAYFVSGGQPTIADLGPRGIVQQTINQQPNYLADNMMVLGDNNTAFVTDVSSVVAFNPTTLQTAWTYASTVGNLTFVAATSGGGVAINDSQQGVIQLDANGNAAAPAAELQGATPYSLGLPILASPDGSELGYWANLATGSITLTADAFLDSPDSPYPEPQGSAVNKRESSPTVKSFTVHFYQPQKSPADHLTFLPGGLFIRTCSDKLGPLNCPTPGAWLYNVEIAATVSDDASNWTAKQSASGKAKGNYGTNGNLVAFTEPITATEDTESPVPQNIQQPAGQKQIFWIDSPGFSYLYTPPGSSIGYGVDSVTDVSNLVSTVCSKSSGVCKSVSWNIQIQIAPGRHMSLNQGALGKAAVNF